MITEEKATKLFCMTDDFCKEFALFYKKCMVENKKKNYDNKPGRMNDEKIVLIHHFVLFQWFHCKYVVCYHCILFLWQETRH